MGEGKNTDIVERLLLRAKNCRLTGNDFHAEECEEIADTITRLRSEREGHGRPCYYCGEPCNGLAGNPGKWPIPLCHADDPGKVKWHHIKCVSDRLSTLPLLTSRRGGFDSCRAYHFFTAA